MHEKSNVREGWFWRNLVLLAALVIRVAAQDAASISSPLSPQEESKTIHLADPRLTIDLVAAEPGVLCPVAIAWNADGRMFVAEMTDYPTGPVSGRIRLLEDLDGDGYYEHSTIFAQNLPFPNGVMPWKNGVLVTAAPDIWFLAGTNHDGMADVRQRILSGFAEGNQQLRANGLFWGIDNWIYGANGRSDGEVRWSDSLSGGTLSIRRRDFRFRPDLGKFEAIAGNSQFGMGHDDWGNRFPVFNNIPIRQVVMEDRYLERAPYLAGTENVVPISPSGDTGKVYPLAPPLLLIPQPAGFFTSACGPSIYRGTLLPDEYNGDAFVCEAVQNLIQRRKLRREGPLFVAERTETNREFLAGADPWFHGVFTATGPDGGFYVVDMYRKYVEHPHWVAKELQTTVPWRTGESHGRIWRIRAKDRQPAAPPKLSHAPSAQLVQFLNHRNGWWRDTAQRLLMERGDISVAAALDELFRAPGTTPLGRLHALYTLDGLHQLSEDNLMLALADADSNVRVHALRLAENKVRMAPDSSTRLQQRMLGLAGDTDPAVRFQFELSAGELGMAAGAPLLTRLANTGAADHWQAVALLSSISRDPVGFLRIFDPPWQGHPNAPQFQFMEKTGQAAASAHGPDEIRLPELFEKRPGVARLALLAGMVQAPGGRERIRRQPELGPEIEDAAGFVSDRSQPPFARVAGIQLVSKLRQQESLPRLIPLLLPAEPQPVQTAAARAVSQLGSSEIAAQVLERWLLYTRETRVQLIASALSSPAMLEALTTALEQGRIAVVEIDPGTRQQLLRTSRTDLRQRLTPVFATKNSSRETVIERFRPAVTLAGSAPRGAEFFSKVCWPCHSIEGSGGKVGPDLASVASRPKETLLVDVLDPNRQVLPDFASYTIDISDGEPVSGVIAAENETGVTVRRQNLPDLTIPRSSIRSIRADGRSPMPEGLEEGMTAQQFADLLEFLQHPNKDLLRLPSP